MIRRVISYFLFFDLIVAFMIALVFLGNNQPIKPILLGNAFSSYIASCSKQLTLNKIEIPNFKSIDLLKKQTDASFEINNAWDAVRYAFLQYQALIDFFNFFIYVFNGMLTVLNGVIFIVNMIIQLLQFVGIMLYQFYVMITDATANPVLVDPMIPPWDSLAV